MIRLVLEREGRAPEAWVCSSDSFLIGRNVDAPDWRLPFPDVSRKHLRFSVHGEHVFVEGLSERSPAYVNKRRIHGLTQLSRGDIIRFGNCRVRIAGIPEITKAPTTPDEVRSGEILGPPGGETRAPVSAPLAHRAGEQAPPGPSAKPGPPPRGSAPVPPPSSSMGPASAGAELRALAPLTDISDMSDIVRQAKSWRDLDKPIGELLEHHMLRRGIAWKRRGTPDLGEDGALVRLFVDTSRHYHRLEWIRRGFAAATVVVAALGGFAVATAMSGEITIEEAPGQIGPGACDPDKYEKAEALLTSATQESGSDMLLLAGYALRMAENSKCGDSFSVEESVREMLSGHRGSVLGKHSAAVMAAAVAPNGRYVASVDQEGQLLLWDRGGREMLGTSDLRDVSAVAWSADSDMLATGDNAGGIKLWDIVDKGGRDRPLELSAKKTLAGRQRRVIALTFSPGGEYLASVDKSGNVRLWDMGGDATGDERGTGTMPASTSSTLVFDGSARHLFGHSGGEVTIWQLDRRADDKLSDKKRQRLPTDHTITSVAVHRDGDRLLTGDEEGLVLLWTLKGGKFSQRRLNRVSSNAISQVAFVPTKSEALFTTQGALMRVNYSERGRKAGAPPSYRLSSEVGDVEALRVDPFGRRALTVSADGGRQLWDLDDAKRSGALRKLDDGGPLWRATAIVPNAAELIAGDADGRVTTWDLLTDRSNAGAWPLAEHSGEIDAIERSPTQQGTPTFFTASRDNAIRKWEYFSHRPRTTLTLGTEAPVKHLAVSRHYIAGAAQERLWVWGQQSAEDKPLIELGAGRPIHNLGLSPTTGGWLVAIDETGEMRSWHVSQGLRSQHDQELAIDGKVSSLIVLEERAFVATTNGDSGQVFSWGLNETTPNRRMIASGGKYTALATSFDGKYIGYGETSGAVHFTEDGAPQSTRACSISSEVTAMALSRETPPRLAFGASKGHVGLLPMKGEAVEVPIADLDDEISNIAFAGDNTLLVAAGEHLYKYRLADANATTPARQSKAPSLDLYGHSGLITTLQVDAGQDYAVSAGLGGELNVWPLRGERLINLLCSKAEVKELSPLARERYFPASTEVLDLCQRK